MRTLSERIIQTCPIQFIPICFEVYRDGVAIETIALAMGHSIIQTTKDHYAFPSLEQKRKAMEIGNPVISSGNEVPEWPDDEDEFARLCGLR